MSFSLYNFISLNLILSNTIDEHHNIAITINVRTNKILSPRVEPEPESYRITVGLSDIKISRNSIIYFAVCLVPDDRSSKRLFDFSNRNIW